MSNKPINLDILQTLPVADALAMLAQAVNNLSDMIQTGVVWENHVKAQRDAENVIVSLPAVIQAAMIEETAQKARKEREEILK